MEPKPPRTTMATIRADFRVLVFGLIMVIMMIWRKGLLRVVRTRFTHPRKHTGKQTEQAQDENKRYFKHYRFEY